ncbi:class I SAM-dependent DNA methyltransferase [Candidatus Phytoplasma solani]|uniref:HsdM family class I SAM-dependent methyltransferase n=1 Tax=Candidatus Phytoplasma solani TaxID=69896 RepID=UPI00358F15E7
MKNESLIVNELYTFLENEKKFNIKKNWESEKTKHKKIQNILNHSSKKNNNKIGKPDLIYVNEKEKLLILIEVKKDITKHESDDSDNNEKNASIFAVNGVKHYLKKFLESDLPSSYKIVGIALSGEIHDRNNQQIYTFIIKKIDDKKNQNYTIQNKTNETNYEILDEKDYLEFFSDYNLEEITKKIDVVSDDINNLLRPINSAERPILLSFLMISLFKKDAFKDDFLQNINASMLIPLIMEKLKENLEYIKQEYVQIFIKKAKEVLYIQILKEDDKEILKNMLKKLRDYIIPLFETIKKRGLKYDIIGHFYRSFLRYAGIADVKNGIVLTPSHIAALFTELIKLQYDDIIIDPCCGSGSFLIAGMHEIINQIKSRKNIPQKQQNEEIKNLKEKGIIGFENNESLFTLAISNMLFNGDGKSSIYAKDFFGEGKETAGCIIQGLKNNNKKPTIGFINPPYGGKDNKKNPTKKEVQFLNKLLDICQRYVIIIAPISTFFQDTELRNSILEKHTLKYIIHMPKDLFEPVASTYTIVAVFKTQIPHDNKEVIFYNLIDDGHKLNKKNGRIDRFNKWDKIKKDLLEKLNNPQNFNNNHNFFKKNISKNDEWTLFEHGETDYNSLNVSDFDKTVRNYAVFQAKAKLDLIGKKIDEITLLEKLNTEIVLKKIEKNKNE